MTTIKVESVKLGRTIWIVSSAEEGKALLANGEPRENIYTETEVEALKGLSEDMIQAIQEIKDTFPGAMVTETEYGLETTETDYGGQQKSYSGKPESKRKVGCV